MGVGDVGGDADGGGARTGDETVSSVSRGERVAARQRIVWIWRAGGVRVWGRATLDLQHTLTQPADAGVVALLAVEGRVWAGVGSNVVVWGE